MIKNYLITTGHLEDALLFRDRDDFVTGMNHVAIAASKGTVIVLSFILMSNHTHFVLRGRHEDILMFIAGIRRSYSMYYAKKYESKHLLRYNSLDIKDFEWGDEVPERIIAYVQMNSVAANICSHPSQYPWGTGSLFFNEMQPSGRRTDSMSKRELKRLVHRKSFESIPGDWIFGEEGFILPDNYVGIRTVESLYRNPSRFNYFLRSSSKARKRLDISEKMLPSFRDQVVAAAVPDLCRTLFHKNGFHELSEDEKTECARQIRYRFSASPNQIARICGVSYDDAARIMDGV